MFRLIKKFFWTCSGATVPILSSDDCQTEHSKYVGIGATILTTGILAGVSGSYAFFMVFQSIEGAIVFGCFWGLMLFNLDRYIVLSMKKRAPVEDASKKAPVEGASLLERLPNWGRELAIAFPRLCLAALIAVVIAKPLELKLFEKEILLEMDFLRDEKIRQYEQATAATQPTGAEGQAPDSRIKVLEKKNQDLRAEIEAAWKRYEEKNQIAIDEAEGRAGTGIPGEKNVYMAKRRDAETMREAYEVIKNERNRLITLNNDEIIRQQGLQNQQAQTNQQKTLTTDGLATRLEAFSRLKDKNDDVWRTNWVLMLLILILELSPILTKLMADYGPYDKVVETNERKVFLKNQLDLDTFEADMKRRLDSHETTQKAMSDVQETFFTRLREGAHKIDPRSPTHEEWQETMDEIFEKSVQELRSNGHDKKK